MVDAALSRRTLLTSATAAAGTAALGLPVLSDSPAEAAGRRRRALIYRGPATLPGCPEAVAVAMRSRGVLTSAYVGPNARTPLTAANLRRASLYVQPGGPDVDTGWRHMRRYRSLIVNWVRGGGHYLGLCLGAYLATDDPGFGLFPGEIWDYKASRGAEIRTENARVLAITWRGRRVPLYFQDGPLFAPRANSGAQIIARYRNGRPAALTVKVGRGRLTLVGPHPEARRGWYSGDGLTPPARWRSDIWHDVERVSLS